MFSFLLYKYIKYSAWFSLWYLLSINFLLIFGYVYTVLHHHKLHIADLKKLWTVFYLGYRAQQREYYLWPLKNCDKQGQV